MRDIEYPTEKLKVSDWDPRTEHKNEKKRAEAEKKYTELLASIKENGIRVPIMVVAKDNGYEIVGGRHRFKAAQELGLKTVPISIHEDAKTKAQKILLSGIENYHRMDPDEKGVSRWVVANYEAEGYTAKQAIQGTKSIDNWFSDSRHKGSDWDDFIRNSVPNKERNTTGSELRYDPKFITICKRIGFAPKYQYQLISITQKLDKSVLDKAERKGLPTNKQITLTTGPLPEHPKIQKELIDEIADMNIDKARARVQGVAHDLTTGRIRKSTSGKSYVIDGRVAKEDDKVLPPIDLRILDIAAAINKYMFVMTQRAVTKGEHEITADFVKNSKEYRMEVIKTLDKRNLINLEQGLKLVQQVTDETLGLIEQEYDAIEMKKNMTGK